jgi:hypothetical protein
MKVKTETHCAPFPPKKITFQQIKCTTNKTLVANDNSVYSTGKEVYSFSCQIKTGLVCSNFLL